MKNSFVMTVILADCPEDGNLFRWFERTTSPRVRRYCPERGIAIRGEHLLARQINRWTPERLKAESVRFGTP